MTEESTGGGSPTEGRLARILVVAAPVLLMAAGLNPYLMPLVFDNVSYHVAAQELAETGRYTFQGSFISIWPPGFSAALVPQVLVGLDSVVASKLFILACVAVGTCLTLSFLRREQHALPAASTLVFALSPAAYLLGTRVLAEWPYFLLSIVFFHLVSRMASNRGIALALLTGVTLGAASLTRWLGVLLGAALVVSAWLSWKRETETSPVRRVLPEAVASVLGALLFLSWVGVVSSNSDTGIGPESNQIELALFAPVDLLEKVADYLYWHDNVTSLPVVSSIPRLLLALPALVVVLGWWLRFRKHGLRPADVHVVAMLGFLCFVEVRHTRYIFVVGPFLVAYVLEVVELLMAKLRGRWSDRALSMGRNAMLVTWVLGCLALDGHLLFRGNAPNPKNATHGGLCMLASPSAHEFYRGTWRDISDACEVIAKDPAPGSIVTSNGASRYVHAFTGRPTAAQPDGAVRYVLRLPGWPPIDTEGLPPGREVWRNGEAVLTLHGE